jgi:zinc/manganese transport system permease protein
VGAGAALSALLAIAEAWGGVALAYATDWPSSFWITALSAGVYLATLAGTGPLFRRRRYETCVRMR